MQNFDIGLSALRAHQQTLTTLGNNIANSSTPGYHRQRPELINRGPLISDNLHIGTGVEVSRISRMRDDAIETALLRNGSLSGYSQQALDVSKQIEAILAPSDTSIHANLSEFFNRLEKVANSPQDLTVRNEMLSSAQELTNGFSNLEQALIELKGDTRAALDDGIAEVNRLLGHLADINQEIFIARGLQREPNDLLDQRDRLMTELSQWIDVDMDVSPSGREYVIVADGAGVVGQNSVGFRLTEQSDGTLALTQSSMHLTIPVTTGRMKALLDANNQLIPETRDRLNALAQQVVQAVDQQHAVGMPDTGPYKTLLGTRAVDDVDQPLFYAGTAFPVAKGDIYVTVTQISTGNRITQKIAVDPLADSLRDVATNLEALTGVTSTVDPVRRTLNINAESGYAIDFAGRVDNAADLSSFTGTAVPKFGGNYNGGFNEQFTVSFSGTGTIGVTPGLQATIRDQSGQIVATHQVGAGYEANTPLQIRDGITVQLASGTVNATDQASVFAVTNSDTTGLLAAAGINSFFEGVDVSGFRVKPEIFQHPESLAGTTTGVPGDALNFAAMASLRDLRFDALGGRTFVEEMADTTADAGLRVQAADTQNQQSISYQERLEADRNSVSGVDVNEEMLKMMEVERAYQAATRFITTVDATLDELFRIVQ